VFPGCDGLALNGHACGIADIPIFVFQIGPGDFDGNWIDRAMKGFESPTKIAMLTAFGGLFLNNGCGGFCACVSNAIKPRLGAAPADREV